MNRPTAFVGVLASISFAACLCLADGAKANIIQDQTDNASSWPFGPVSFGQSFVATPDIAILTGFQFGYHASNQPLRPAASPVLELFDGEGFGGTMLLSTQYFLGEDEPAGLKFLDLSGFGITLSPGQSYTFRLTQQTDAEGGLQSINADVYPEGNFYSDNFIVDDREMRFGVFGIVPEPATLALVGLGGATLLRRRR